MTPAEEYLWDPDAEPVEEIAVMERALAPYRLRPGVQRADAMQRPRGSVSATRRAAYAVLLAAAAVLVVAVARTVWVARSAPPWSVALEGGSAMVSGRPLAAGHRLRAGEVLTLGPDARARVTVGRIGDVYLSPGSEVVLVDDAADGHRLVLRRGDLHARIWAPPRFFVVDTRWASAVDLGCIYTMRVDETGAGWLEVLYGSVELMGGGRRVLVPAGVGARMETGGPGIPWPLTTNRGFRAATERLALGAPDSAALATVLATADARATITLLHLLPRVAPAHRAPIVARMAELVPLPPGVGREAVLELRPEALRAWEPALRKRWPAEPDTPWRRFLVRWGLAKPVAVLQRGPDPLSG